MKANVLQKLTNEEVVFKIVATNNSQMFAVLYDRFSKVVYNKCFGFAKNKEEAEDLTNDIFIRLCVMLNTFKGNLKFSTGFFSFTYNYCINYVQRNAHKKKEKVTVVTVQIKEKDASEEMENAQLFELKSEKLVRAMSLIGAKDKMVLFMKYQDDMSIVEVKKSLKCW
ncbi:MULTISPECIES: RNA polymerase sigma factor [unclassified Polaribacter]|uniref:RNA polymerase sigma factor n=1 Tax=unclassified Polaribacter TaxID=196858 RepID=UPI001CB910B1|nr:MULTISPECIES: sigma-70 family RNA polymerase sigma factor [unclassified Polaribacter]